MTIESANLAHAREARHEKAEALKAKLQSPADKSPQLEPPKQREPRVDMAKAMAKARDSLNKERAEARAKELAASREGSDARRAEIERAQGIERNKEKSR